MDNNGGREQNLGSSMVLQGSLHALEDHEKLYFNLTCAERNRQLAHSLMSACSASTRGVYTVSSLDCHCFLVLSSTHLLSECVNKLQ